MSTISSRPLDDVFCSRETLAKAREVVHHYANGVDDIAFLEEILGLDL